MILLFILAYAFIGCTILGICKHPRAKDIGPSLDDEGECFLLVFFWPIFIVICLCLALFHLSQLIGWFFVALFTGAWIKPIFNFLNTDGCSEADTDAAFERVKVKVEGIIADYKRMELENQALKDELAKHAKPLPNPSDIPEDFVRPT